ncbi:MAG: pseudoazurin [Pseudomonadota bacterium]
MRIQVSASLLLFSLFITLPAAAADHKVKMLNAATGDAQHTNVFEPRILYVEPGDTVTFIPSDAGHNAASKRGMLPQGAEPWNSPMDTEFTVTLSEPGVYGYICVPHYEMGMVGLIVVGTAEPNLKTAKKVRHPGSARKAFRALFKELDSRAQ